MSLSILKKLLDAPDFPQMLEQANLQFWKKISGRINLEHG
jgi:hypothetical protein